MEQKIKELEQRLNDQEVMLKGLLSVMSEFCRNEIKIIEDHFSNRDV